jgi:hypothetical protein
VRVVCVFFFFLFFGGRGAAGHRVVDFT